MQEKLVGNLTYAAQVAPFGRPFLSALSEQLSNTKHQNFITVSNSVRSALLIWKIILMCNRELSFNFILGRLPRAKNEWFIDASTNFGCGGLVGRDYFMVENSQLKKSKFCGKQIKFENVKIAYRELISAVIAFVYFSEKSPSSLVRINCDNTNVVSWLNKSRCSKKFGISPPLSNRAPKIAI